MNKMNMPREKRKMQEEIWLKINGMPLRGDIEITLKNEQI